MEQYSPKDVWREDEVLGREEADAEEQGEHALEGVNGAREVLWSDDAASTHTAFKEEVQRTSSSFEEEGEWAQNLFYAYARRVGVTQYTRRRPK
jgi:hypothetical protein